MESHPPDNNNQVPCPASHYGGATDEDRIHHATPAELAANGGVCAKCRQQFDARQRPQMENEEKDRKAGIANATDGKEEYRFADGTGFVQGHVEPTVDFTLNDEGLEAEGLDARAVMAIAKFCRLLFEIGGRNREKFFQAAHEFCFAAHLHPEQHLSGEVIAKRFGITKAAFFKQVNRYRDILNLPRIAGAKGHAARKTYSAKMKESHAQRRTKKDHQDTGNFSGLLNQAHHRSRAGH